MSDQKQQMIAAADGIERSAREFAAHVTTYLEAYRIVTRAAHPNENQQLTLEQTVGGAALNRLLILRLRALGLGPMLERARTTGMIDDLAGELQPKIAAHVA